MDRTSSCTELPASGAIWLRRASNASSHKMIAASTDTIAGNVKLTERSPDMLTPEMTQRHDAIRWMRENVLNGVSSYIENA
ncbi:hypothetical protein [Paraburkholderia sediminicola]|uniref:hypothetical protein n=1 Tax=Paraburkholderia sediminicola TaxID=458836 RepID=UPI0038BE042A